MKQRKRGHQAAASGADSSKSFSESAATSSSVDTVGVTSSTTTQKHFSSFSSTTTSSSSLYTSTEASNKEACANASSKFKQSGVATMKTAHNGQKPPHSQTMLLELLLTVTRASLIILTPLVAGMILRVAPSMMEPIYGSIFIEELFLKLSLASVGVGVMLGIAYTYFSGSTRTSTMSSALLLSKSKPSRTAAESTAAGFHKDANLRKGIITCLDMCALLLASSLFTIHVMFKYSGEFGPWKGPHLTQLFFAYPVLASLGFANTLACVLRSYERVHVRTWMSCVVIHVGAILGLTLVIFQMAPQGPNCPRVYAAAILVAVVS
ncbi:hypothetical protein BX616_006904, partial [Lobosporangium transversale]